MLGTVLPGLKGTLTQYTVPSPHPLTSSSPPQPHPAPCPQAKLAEWGVRCWVSGVWNELTCESVSQGAENCLFYNVIGGELSSSNLWARS